MYKKTLTAAFAAILLTSGSAFAADKPGADWISIEEAIAKVKQAGYTTVYGIEADREGWEGEGEKQDGRKHEFKVDGRSGELTKDKPD
ncbi:PepSY domain-containing protein [Stutzerimonas azotifigens]|uniref:PepSY domain-containing protein n=1 Tax=Stutzerimonas azotifigens TaxID=291995 RepID=A0ABR5Z6Q7_9GAMM|nr:PepSY domain-containing protein [Stutzerimonas azotifigens]MBA1275852.1 PepSY domain-containing protein [Stutzerimonas azotifigens]